MKESRFEFSHLARRRGDAHGFLSSSQQNVILVFGNDGIVDGTVRLVLFEGLQIDGIKELGREIGTRRDKEGLVAVEPQAIDFLFVRQEFVHQIATAGIVQLDHAIVVTDQEGFVKGRPLNVGGIDALVAHFGNVNFEAGSFGIRTAVGGSLKDHDFGIVFDKGIGNGGKHLAALGPTHAADGTPVDVRVQALSRFHLPELAGGVRTGREETGRHAIAIQIPNRSLVSVEGSQSLAILGPPHRRHEILGSRKQQISVVVELNDSNGTFVSLQ